MEKQKQNKKIRNIMKQSILTAVFFFVLMSSSAFTPSFLFPLPSSPVAHAQIANPNQYENPNSRDFRLVVCDGPTLPTAEMIKSAEAELHRKYVPCDFNGLMRQVQHIINIMLVVGILAAIVGITYAGYLYIMGTQEGLKKARGMLPRMAGGFVLMLTAWFIVFQILHWLTGNGAGFGVLLGNP
jgi:hypothetical protein